MCPFYSLDSCFIYTFNVYLSLTEKINIFAALKYNSVEP